MSEATLNNLLEYLYGALTPNNMMWLGEHLIEHAKIENEEVTPYTKEEIIARISQSELDSAEGRVYDFDDVMHELEEELIREEDF